MVCKPVKTKGLLMGILIAGFFFGTIIWGINYALGPEDKTFKLLLLGPAYLMLLVYTALWLGLMFMKYTASNDSLIISWLHKRYVIPWTDITEVIRVTGRMNLISFLGVSWPGYIAGTYDLKGVATCKMFGTDLEQLLVIKAGPLAYGITPSTEFINSMGNLLPKEIAALDLFDVPEDVVGKMVSEDLAYLGLSVLNVLCIIFLMVYLAIFFPGSGADPMVMLLLVLALAIFAFNMVNVSRLYHYLPMAAYLLWLVGITINITFLVISVSIVGFGL